MVLKWLSQVVDGLSLRALAQRLDKRRLQQEIDTHRLLLLTTYHAEAVAAAGRGSSSGGSSSSSGGGGSGSGSSEALPDADDIAARCSGLEYEAMQAAVAANLRAQVARAARELHEAFIGAGDRTAAAVEASTSAAAGNAEHFAPAQGGAGTRSGLAAAVGAGDPSDPTRGGPAAAAAAGPGPGSSRSVSMQEVAALLQERLGFVTRVAPSAVGHAAAGDGLWLEGGALPGQVVALYPGLVYPPLQHKHIPGYPRIDIDNDYLISRFDMAILDAKPWGKGLQREGESLAAAAGAAGAAGAAAAAWPGGSEGEAGMHHPGQQRWPLIGPKSSMEQRRALLQMAALVEGRHPLALAHYANHPPGGVQPNVMVAAFDLHLRPGEPRWLPRYVPTLQYSDFGGDDDRAGSTRASPASSSVAGAEVVGVAPAPAVGLALVATRELRGPVELLLNYRLSPHLQRPEWYVPVDAEEEQRRWA